MSPWLWPILHPLKARADRRFRQEQLALWTPERIAERQAEIALVPFADRSAIEHFLSMSDDPVIWVRAESYAPPTRDEQ